MDELNKEKLSFNEKAAMLSEIARYYETGNLNDLNQPDLAVLFASGKDINISRLCLDLFEGEKYRTYLFKLIKEQSSALLDEMMLSADSHYDIILLNEDVWKYRLDITNKFETYASAYYENNELLDNLYRKGFDRDNISYAVRLESFKTLVERNKVNKPDNKEESLEIAKFLYNNIMFDYADNYLKYRKFVHLLSWFFKAFVRQEGRCRYHVFKQIFENSILFF